MDETVGRAWYDLGARDDQLDRNLKDAEQKLARSGEQGAAQFERAHVSAQDRVVSGLGKVRTALAAIGIAVGVSTAIQFFDSAITKASDLAETTSKVSVVFGNASDAVLQMGEDSATALGMSENAALSAAGTYGNLFRAMGITEEVSAQMSVRLVQLAADLASFNNMDPTLVLDKLRAGLSGETEPLRALGVNLSAARIQQEALNSGLWDGTGALTAAQMAQATYALILQDTALAQGDFSRTSDGLANQQRILSAQLDNLTAAIGQRLLPVMVKLANFANDTLVPALEKVLGLMDSLSHARLEPGPLSAFEEAARAAAIADRALTNADENRRGWVRGWAETPAALQGAADQVETAARRFFQPVYGEAAEARRRAIAEVRALPGDLAKALRDGMNDVESGMNDLTSLMEESLSDAAKIAYLKGVLSSEELARGLTDERADVRAAALQVKEDAEEQLRLLESGAADAAVDAGVTFAESLRQQRVAAGLAAADVGRAATGALEAVDGVPAGANLGREFADGLYGMRTYLDQKARDYAQYGTRILRGYSPPREGPLREIDKWGFNVGRTWADNFVRGVNLRDVLSALGGTSGVLGGLSAATGGTVSTPAFAPGVSGPTYHLHFAGRESVVESAYDAIDEVTRLGVFSDGRAG